VYGSEGSTTGFRGILAPLDPWAGNPSNDPAIARVRPWAPPENQQVVKNSKDPSVVAPPTYDTNPVRIRVTGVQDVAVAPLSDRRLQLWAANTNGELFSTWKVTTDPNADWAPWEKDPGISAVRHVAVAPLSDGRLQLWASDANGVIFSTWKVTTDPNADWVPWFDSSVAV